MNQAAQLNSFKVNSQFFLQQLDALIIKLTGALAVEHGVKPDPEAKEMVRRLLLERAHSLMSEESEKFADRYVQNIRDAIQAGRLHGNQGYYEFIKLVGLDNA
jgi:hypothetical protein